jgi:hypothetical protein
MGRSRHTEAQIIAALKQAGLVARWKMWPGLRCQRGNDLCVEGEVLGRSDDSLREQLVRLATAVGYCKCWLERQGER